MIVIPDSRIGRQVWGRIEQQVKADGGSPLAIQTMKDLFNRRLIEVVQDEHGCFSMFITPEGQEHLALLATKH